MIEGSGKRDRLAITELEGRQELGAHESKKPFKAGKEKRKTNNNIKPQGNRLSTTTSKEDRLS